MIFPVSSMKRCGFVKKEMMSKRVDKVAVMTTPIYRVDKKYASAPVHYQTRNFLETPFMISTFDSFQK